MRPLYFKMFGHSEGRQLFRQNFPWVHQNMHAIGTEGHWGNEGDQFEECEDVSNEGVQKNIKNFNCLQDGHYVHKCFKTTGHRVNYVRTMTNKKAFWKARDEGRPFVPILYPPSLDTP